MCEDNWNYIALGLEVRVEDYIYAVSSIPVGVSFIRDEECSQRTIRVDFGGCVVTDYLGENNRRWKARM